jgi:hypothetical protein
LKQCETHKSRFYKALRNVVRNPGSEVQCLGSELECWSKLLDIASSELDFWRKAKVRNRVSLGEVSEISTLSPEETRFLGSAVKVGFSVSSLTGAIISVSY